MVTSTGIRAGKAFIEIYGDDSRLRKDMKRIEFRLKSFGSSMKSTGSGLLRFSGLMAAPLIAGGKAFASFQQQMAKVETMLDEPTKHMGRFKKEIRSMSKEFGESTQFLAAGLYDILSASIPASKALDVLTVSTKAAKAGNTETGIAADAITTILNSYQLEAEKAGFVSDWLFNIVKRGKTDFASLAPVIGNVTSVAFSAGVGLEEVGASIAFLTRNGIKTEEAMTAVRAIIAGFLKPTKEAAEAAAEMGFKMNSATIQSEGLYGVFSRISKLPPDAVAKLFPNVRALKGVLPLLSKLDGFADDIEAMGNSAGKASAAFKVMAGESNDVTHSFMTMWQTVIDLGTEIGKSIREPMVDAMEEIKKFTASIAEWISENEEWVRSWLGTAVAIAAVGSALTAFGGILTVMVAGVSSAITIFGVMMKIAIGLKVAIAALIWETEILIFLYGSMAAVMAGIIAIAIAPFVYSLVSAWNDHNKALERGIELNKELDELLSKRASRAIKAIGEMEDPEQKEEFIQGELKRVSKNQEGRKYALKQARKDGDTESVNEIKERRDADERYKDSLEKELQKVQKEIQKNEKIEKQNRMQQSAFNEPVNEGPAETEKKKLEAEEEKQKKEKEKREQEEKEEKNRVSELKFQMEEMNISRQIEDLQDVESGDTSNETQQKLDEVVMPSAERILEQILAMQEKTLDRKIEGDSESERLQSQLEKEGDLDNIDSMKDQLIDIVESMMDKSESQKEKEFKKQANDAKKAAKELKNSFSSRGTFDAKMVQQISITKPQDEMLKVQKHIMNQTIKVVDNTHKISKNTKKKKGIT
jgi:TP901 family phage tail tape measure protein